VLHVTAQVIDALRLFFLIADGEGAIAYRTKGGGAIVSAMIGSHQQAVGHVTGELTADTTARADYPAD